jgi:ribonuclease BN (tRNA processing enzyme)
MKAEIAILGSGCGLAMADRFCTSIALLVEPHLYLFDCGEPCSALLRRAGIDALALRTLFISHMHPDHISGLAQLVSAITLTGHDDPTKKFKPWSVHRSDPWYRRGMWFPAQEVANSTRQQVEVVMPAVGIEAMRNFLAALYLDPVRLSFDLRFSPVVKGLAYDDGIVRVISAPNAHLDVNPAYRELPASRRESYSYRIEVGGCSLVFSGDIDRLAELEPLLRGRIEMLLLEVAHYEPEGINEFVRGFDIGRVVLTHIHPGLEDRLGVLVSAWGDRRFVIAEDGLRLFLGAVEEKNEPALS